MQSPLSARARALLEGGMSDYVFVHHERHTNAHRIPGNPDGYVGLCVAENALMWDELEPWLRGPFALEPSVAGYGDMTGSEELRSAISRVLEQRVFRRSVDPSSVVTMAGAGAILDALFRGLADPGEGVLVPTPSYAGFWPDVQTRNDLQILTVARSPDDGYRLTTEMLDRALAAAPVPVRALLYTNPDNPLGTVASGAEVREVLAWARANHVHLVSDEIYALSVFGSADFESVGTEPLGELVHVVWAASKDFAMSGLRCGVLVTENETVREVMSTQAMWSSVSTHTQALLTRMWQDDAFVDRFVRVNRDRLGSRYARLAGLLSDAGIDHHPAEAGFFTVVDLRDHLVEPTWEAEAALWQALIDETNVNLTPGSACRSPEPGLFRLCFASVPEATLEEGLRRLAAHLG